MSQLFNNNRETLTKYVTWKNHSVIAKFRIIKGLKGKKIQELPSFAKFVTEVLIFRSSSSKMFCQIDVLKHFAILEPFFNKVADLILQNTCGGCFCILAAANTFFSYKSGTHWRQWHRFLSQTPLKTGVKPQKQPLQLFCKERCS